MMAHRDAAVLGDPHRSREARPVAERPRVDARFVLHVLREFERAHHRQDVLSRKVEGNQFRPHPACNRALTFQGPVEMLGRQNGGQTPHDRFGRSRSFFQ